MKQLQSLFKGVTATLALIPGLSILIKNLGVPDSDYKNIFFAVIQSSGCLILLLLYLNRERVDKMDKKRKTKYSIISFILFFISLLFYLYLFDTCVTTSENGSIFFPLYKPASLINEIIQCGGEIGFISKYLSDGAKLYIETKASTQLILSVITLLLVYVFSLSCLVFSFGLISTNNNNDKVAPKKKSNKTEPTNENTDLSDND